MITSDGTPEWAHRLCVSFESGASRQFVLYGNVHDRRPVRRELLNIEDYVRDELLGDFDVIFTYDLGNGLTVAHGAEQLGQWVPSAIRSLPLRPLESLRFVSRYLRHLANLIALEAAHTVRIAIIIRGAGQLLPADGDGFEHGAITAVVREWGASDPFARLPFVSILLSDNLADLEPLIAFAPHTVRVRVPLPSTEELHNALQILQSKHAQAIPATTDLPGLAAAMVGVSLQTLEQLAKVHAYNKQPLQAVELVTVKKQLVEQEAAGVVEFLQSARTLDDYHGQDALKQWLRQDVALWNANDLRALPMGYLLIGPVGTGKTFLVECLAGEVGVPVVKLSNFRDKWIGSSEGNLERVFRLARALGRCIVFVEEADQTLGRRDSGIADGGLSGRIYSMIAQEMADTANRGKVMWVLASSRPDLIEIDLKRPGRIDFKIPILPTTTRAESAALLSALAQRYGLDISAEHLMQLDSPLPNSLTPGAAESLIVKAYRMVRTQSVPASAALLRCLTGYQPPIAPDMLEMQIRLAIQEATDLAFVPEALRHFAQSRLAAQT